VKLKAAACGVAMNEVQLIHLSYNANANEIVGEWTCTKMINRQIRTMTLMVERRLANDSQLISFSNPSDGWSQAYHRVNPDLP